MYNTVEPVGVSYANVNAFSSKEPVGVSYANENAFSLGEPVGVSYANENNLSGTLNVVQTDIVNNTTGHDYFVLHP